MDQDILFQMGSMVGRAIPIAMGLVAIVAGWIMVFDAYRLYQNRETRVVQGRQDTTPYTASDPAPQTPEPTRPRQGTYGYRQARRSRV